MKVIINDNILKVKVSATPDSISKGMMGKKFDESFDGMLFFMPNTSEQSFWMYNCIIPLDIIMIDGGEINVIHHSCSPCHNQSQCESYKGYGSEVLELPGGTCKSLDIKKGDRVSFSLF